MADMYIFPHLFSQSFAYISMDSFILHFAFIIHYYFIYYVAQLALALTIGNSFCWPLCPFGTPNHCGLLMCFILFCFVLLSASLFSSTTRWSRIILHISCPSPRISHLSNEPAFLSLKNSLRKQYLFFVPSTDRSRKYICISVIVSS